MSTELTRCTGIDHEHRHACALGQRSVAFVELHRRTCAVDRGGGDGGIDRHCARRCSGCGGRGTRQPHLQSRWSWACSCAASLRFAARLRCARDRIKRKIFQAPAGRGKSLPRVLRRAAVMFFQVP